MNMLQWIKRAGRVHQQRRHLSHLSDDMLKDIGFDREQARREVNRWPWDVDRKSSR